MMTAEIITEGTQKYFLYYRHLSTPRLIMLPRSYDSCSGGFDYFYKKPYCEKEGDDEGEKKGKGEGEGEGNDD